MRKTALTQLINKYEKEAKKTNSPTIEYLLKMVINDIKEMKLLETEREQIEEAYHQGQTGLIMILNESIDHSAGEPDYENRFDAQQYYKDTYE